MRAARSSGDDEAIEVSSAGSRVDTRSRAAHGGAGCSGALQRKEEVVEDEWKPDALEIRRTCG